MTPRSRFSSLLLAMLTLVSSSSFSIGMHLCGGHLQDISIISEPDPCPMERGLPSCHQVVKNSCCQNISVVHSSDEFNTSVSSISEVPVEIVAVTPPAFIELIHQPAIYSPIPADIPGHLPLRQGLCIRFRSLLI